MNETIETTPDGFKIKEMKPGDVTNGGRKYTANKLPQGWMVRQGRRVHTFTDEQEARKYAAERKLVASYGILPEEP